MKLCRFQSLVFSANQVKRAGAPSHPEPLAGVIAGDTIQEFAGELFGSRRPTGRTFALSDVNLMPPAMPSKIVCVGRNYREHAAELNHPVPKEPLIFLKPPSSVIGPDELIVMPPQSQRVDYEGELAVIIGRTCARLGAEEDVRPYILGFTCLNDVTARDIQKAEEQFTRAKGFDSFCPLGPVVETELDLPAATVETYVNGARRQAGRVADMIFPVAFILRWISQVMTLVPGDVIATGTPSGVGPLAAGDVVEVVVSGIGTLRNSVAAQES
jgi:2-keto-4-pentenoate hydratase/2-oxohepta-3-ene-1,7-dioic acid hydratase in catechol pathway